MRALLWQEGPSPEGPSLEGFRPGSVLAVGTMGTVAETIRITAAQLGHELDRATVAEITEGGDGVVVAIGDVASAFKRLADAGFKIGVLTSDDRHTTTAELKSLGLERWIDGLSLRRRRTRRQARPSRFPEVGGAIWDRTRPHRHGWRLAVGCGDRSQCRGRWSCCGGQRSHGRDDSSKRRCCRGFDR